MFLSFQGILQSPLYPLIGNFIRKLLIWIESVYWTPLQCKFYRAHNSQFQPSSTDLSAFMAKHSRLHDMTQPIYSEGLALANVTQLYTFFVVEILATALVLKTCRNAKKGGGHIWFLDAVIHNGNDNGTLKSKDNWLTHSVTTLLIELSCTA